MFVRSFRRALVVWLVVSTAVMAGRQDGRFDIYWIDVEGGAATLLVTPENESLLVDTGNPGLRDARRISQVVTEVASLGSIDHLVITHYHRDHYGGAETLASMLPLGHVYDNGKFAGMPDNPGAAYWSLKCGQRHILQPGDVLGLKASSADSSAWQVRCLAARKTFVAPEEVAAARNEDRASLHRPKDRDGSDNANSVVLLLRFGSFEFFDGGDLTWNQEQRLVYPYNLVGEVDVYQVSHHGLDSSNNPIVLHSLRPRVAIMNNGDRKGCMPEVFTNLQSVDSLEAIYQVHKNLRPDGRIHNVPDEFIANHGPKEKCQGNYIKLSVAPDSQSYTVTIPAHGHQQTYETK